jgi:adenosine deaminase
MKLDLHRHLEGSHSAAALADVAVAFDMRDPLFWDEQTRRHRTAAELAPSLTMTAPTDDARVFYGCIQKARAAYVSEAAIGELARRAFVEAAADTDGFEMRISLFSMTRTLLDNERIAWRDLAPSTFAERARRLLLAVLAARDAASAACGKPMLVRLGFSRTFESEAHYRALAAILPEHKDALCGLDVLGIVTGADREPMPAALVDILSSLRAHLPDLSVHAGEFEDHRSIERTLALSPQAIGHGVHAAGSDAVMTRLVEDDVTLEVCPHSNALLIPTALRALTDARGSHPLVTLQRARVRCVLGSDDPTPMGTSFSKEWTRAAALGADMALLQHDIERRFAALPRPR